MSNSNGHQLKSFSWVILLLSIILVFIPCVSMFGADKDRLDIEYYYYNPCASCDDEQKFIALFNETVQGYEEDVEFDLKLYNTFQTSAFNRLKEYFKKYNLSKEEQMYSSYLFVGDTVLKGQAEISGKLREVFIKVKQAKNKRNKEILQTNVVYFYIAACKECSKVDRYLSSIDKIYEVTSNGNKFESQLIIKKYSLGESDNIKLIKDYFKRYRVPEAKQFTPVLFIGDVYLSGFEAINKGLVYQIKQGKGIYDTSGLTAYHLEDRKILLSDYEIVGVFITGIINGINPCSLSLLLFFISMLISRNTKILKPGILFILGKFVAYFSLGTIFYNIISLMDESIFQKIEAVIKVILLAITFLLVLLNIKDFISARKEKYDKIKLQLPTKLRTFNHNCIRAYTGIKNESIQLFISFFLGFIISIGEFLCTGQIFLFTILYVLKASQYHNLQAAGYFLIYIFALIIPLVLLVIIINKGKEIIDISEVIRERLHVIKIINAIVFTVFTVIIFLWY